MNEKQARARSRRGRFVRIFHGRKAAALVLVMALGLTGAAWVFSQALVEEAREERFEFRTREIETAIRDRMILYEQVLWGGVGLHNATDDVSREEWEGYVTILDLDGHWPGFQGLGYAIPVDPEDKDAHIEQIRAEGFPEYTIAPFGVRDTYSAIIYLEPFDASDERAFGFDMWSNDMRRAAMARARDSGLAATSGMITLVQETGNQTQKGFLTYVPVYSEGIMPTTVEARRAAFQGWVYAPFRIEDLMIGILGSDLNDVHYEIFDGAVAPENLLFDSKETFKGNASADFERSTSFAIQGRSWNIVFHSASSFGTSAESAQPTIVAIAGLTIDLLLFYVITSLGFLTKSADVLAEEKTAELRLATEALEERSILLEQQAEQLQRSNAELGQFAVIASHDLREPLRTLRSYSTLLSERYDGDLGEEGNRWLRYIATASERMSDLIRELLNYSQIDRQTQEPEPISLATVVERALTSLQHEITETGLTIDVSELPVVVGDALQLERLFQNLIANAAKYRSRQKPHVEIFGSDEGTVFRVYVKDNGIGIKPEYQQRVFEIFRRVSSQGDRAGAGIGLAVCHKVVTAHGGTIGVESEFGCGSTFWFTIPYKSQLATTSAKDGQLLADVNT